MPTRKRPVAAKPAETVETPEVKTAEVEKDTIKVMLMTPYPQVMPVTGTRFLPNDPVIVPNNAWVKARIKDKMLIEVK